MHHLYVGSFKASFVIVKCKKDVKHSNFLYAAQLEYIIPTIFLLLTQITKEGYKLQI